MGFFNLPEKRPPTMPQYTQPQPAILPTGTRLLTGRIRAIKAAVQAVTAIVS
jgi:hypothetical protein